MTVQYFQLHKSAQALIYVHFKLYINLNILVTVRRNQFWKIDKILTLHKKYIFFYILICEKRLKRPKSYWYTFVALQSITLPIDIRVAAVFRRSYPHGDHETRYLWAMNIHRVRGKSKSCGLACSDDR